MPTTQKLLLLCNNNVLHNHTKYIFEIHSGAPLISHRSEPIQKSLFPELILPVIESGISSFSAYGANRQPTEVVQRLFKRKYFVELFICCIRKYAYIKLLMYGMAEAQETCLDRSNETFIACLTHKQICVTIFFVLVPSNLAISCEQQDSTLPNYVSLLNLVSLEIKFEIFGILPYALQ